MGMAGAVPVYICALTYLLAWPHLCFITLFYLIERVMLNTLISKNGFTLWVRISAEVDWGFTMLYRYILKKEMATPLQYSCLENSMDRGFWWSAVHGVAKSQT